MEFIYWLNNDLFLNSILDFVYSTFTEQNYVAEDEYYDLHIAENITCSFAYYPINIDTYCICPELCFVDDIKKISAESHHLFNEDFMIFRMNDNWFELTVWHGYLLKGKINLIERDGQCIIKSRNLSAFSPFFSISKEKLNQLLSNSLEKTLEKLIYFSGYDLDVDFRYIKNNKLNLSAEIFKK